MQSEDEVEDVLILKADCSRETCQNLEEKGLPLALKIATTFGLMTAMVHSISSNKKASLDDSKHETIATLLQKSLLRCSSFKKFSANQDINCHLLIDHMKELVRLLLGREANFDASMVNVEQLLETLTTKIGNTLGENQ